MIFNWYNRPAESQKTGGDGLAEALRLAFGPCDIYLVNPGVYAVFCEHPYEVWCSRSVIRNHPGVLQTIATRPRPPGEAREWTRDGFVMAVDLVPSKTPPGVVSQLDIMSL